MQQDNMVSNFMLLQERQWFLTQEDSLRNMWNDIELLTNDDTGSGYLSVGSRKEHGTALYQVDMLVKISSEKVVIITLTVSFTEFLLSA